VGSFQASCRPDHSTGIKADRSAWHAIPKAAGLSQNYRNGQGGGDNENPYTGFNTDTTRSTNNRRTGNNNQIRFPPRRDGRDITINTFGSAHPAGFNVVFCDGSVRLISYTIDEFNYMRLGNRGDGQAMNWDF
jgi:prepilin-type processing-associated H-X9-DG protein